MCRALAYLGEPVLLDDLLFKPDSSLVKQTYDPRMLHMLNLAGMGVVAWDRSSHDATRPFTYRVPDIPIFDPNLKALALKVKASCVLAHVRGVAYDSAAAVGPHNLHPFRFNGVRLAMAHNGDLSGFGRMRYALVEHVRADLLQHIRGTTDSEWIYALILSQLADPFRDAGPEEIFVAVENALRIIRRVRATLGIRHSSSVNLFLGDGNDLVAVRFTFDFGRYNLEAPDRVHEANMRFLSLWYTAGREYGFHDGDWQMRGSGIADSVMVASEPLTRDVSSWLEVPEYSLLYVGHTGARPTIETVPLDA